MTYRRYASPSSPDRRAQRALGDAPSAWRAVTAIARHEGYALLTVHQRGVAAHLDAVDAATDAATEVDRGQPVHTLDLAGIERPARRSRSSTQPSRATIDGSVAVGSGPRRAVRER